MKIYLENQLDLSELSLKDSNKDNKDISNPKIEKKISLLPKFYPFLLLLIIIASIVSGATFPIFGYLFSKMITNLFTQQESAKEKNLHIMIYMIADGIIIFVFLILLFFSVSKLFSKYTEKLRCDGFTSLVYYDSAFYDKKKNSPQTLSTALRDESQKVLAFGGPILAILFLLIFCIIGGLIIAMIEEPILATIYFVMIVIHVLIISKAGEIIRAGFTHEQSDNLIYLTSSALTNYKSVTVLNLQEYFYKKYEEELVRWAKENAKRFFKAGFFYTLRFTNDFFTLGSILMIGAYLVKEGIIKLNGVFNVLQVLNSSSWILIIVSTILPDITAAVNASKAIGKLVSYPTQIDSKSKDGLMAKISGKIEFSEVNFTYNAKDSPVLNNCSFILRPGETLGITGKTGSGKSTIAMLLLRFYNPSSGAIYIDNQRIEDYNVKHLRNQIAWVGQEPVLFQGSIYENIKLGNEDVSKDQALHAIEKAQGIEIINLYGIDTDVGVKGNFLSGGQKQRIAIARALARNPSVLILDEATSALDNTTEESLMKALNKEKMTIISIAHRIGTIVDFDHIMVIDKGVISQRGTHAELSISNGIYRKFFKRLTV